MLTTRKRIVALYVDRATQQWVVLDEEGRLWVIPAAADAWEQRTPFAVTDETELELVPGHYKYMLGLPY
jgi:hypothetical protein